MATQSVPGTVIPVGASISPAGGFGAQGPTGPQGAAPPLADATRAGSVNILSGNATDYIGGDNACHPLSGIAKSFYFPTFTANATIDCTGLLLIGVRLVATAGASHILTLNNLLDGAYINVELANSTGGSTVLKFAGTDSHGTTLAGFILVSGGTQGDAVATGLSTTNGLAMMIFGNLQMWGTTPTLTLTGIK